MKEIKIDLLDIHNKQQNHTIDTVHQLVFPKYFMLFLSLAFVLTGTTVLSYQQSQSSQSPISKTWNSLMNFTPLQTLTIGTERTLDGEEEDRINVLLLGIGGKQHDGPYLSDTIMIASIKPSTHGLALISIPRDLVVQIPDYGWRKINEVDSYGELSKEGAGAEFARQTLSALFDIPLHYVVRLDFNGFEQIVDTLGGLDITVDQTFTDYTYPTLNYKYQTVSFKAGPQHMDGATALKFVRSRHSINNHEGSDFARSKRQQKVILALKEKLLSFSFLSNPQKISTVTKELHDSIATNIQGWELLRIAALARQIDETAIINTSIDGASGLVYDDIIQGAYVLRPSDGTYDAIKARMRNVYLPGALEPIPLPAVKRAVPEKKAEGGIKKDAETSAPPISQKPTAVEIIPQESATITIRNGTAVEGLASKNADMLTQLQFTIESLGNAAMKGVEKTILIDQSKGKKPNALGKLLSLYRPTLDLSPTDELIAGSNSDFIIILGSDAAHVRSKSIPDVQGHTQTVQPYLEPPQ